MCSSYHVVPVLLFMMMTFGGGEGAQMSVREMLTTGAHCSLTADLTQLYQGCLICAGCRGIQ